MTKRSPEEVLRDLEQLEDEDQDMEAVLAMTPGARRAELARAGFDLDAVHAQAAALHARALAANAPAPAVAAPAPAAVAPARSLPRRTLRAILPLAAMFTSLVAIVAIQLGQPTTVTAPADEKAAADLRASATASCAAARWRECLERLDHARSLDPDGDALPAVQSLRQRARAAIGQ